MEKNHSLIECHEILERISDYIDGDAEPEVCEEIRRHLEGCDDCDNFIDSVEKTVELFRRDSVPMPSEKKKNLHRILREQCGKMKE